MIGAFLGLALLCLIAWLLMLCETACEAWRWWDD